MSNKELKPCPFCGGEAKVMGSDSDPFFMVVCLKCGLKAKWYHDLRDEATIHWNERNYLEKQDSSNVAISEQSCKKSCKDENATLKPLVPKWQENEALAWIVIEISQFCVLFFDYRKQSKSLIFSIRDKVEDIYHYEEIGTFNTLEEAKQKANECIRELGERLVYFANNIKTKE